MRKSRKTGIAGEAAGAADPSRQEAWRGWQSLPPRAEFGAAQDEPPDPNKHERERIDNARMQFKAAAEAVTKINEEVRPYKRVKKRSGEGKSFTARVLAADYLKLCRDPLKDLNRWLAEDKKHGRALRSIASLIDRKDKHADTGRTTVVVGKIGRLCRDALRELCGGLGEDRRAGGRHVDRMSVGSRADPHRPYKLQQVSEDRRGTVALSSPVAVDCSWPDAMVKELAAVKTIGDRIAWESRWPEHLSGRAAQYKLAQAKPVRPHNGPLLGRRSPRR